MRYIELFDPVQSMDDNHDESEEMLFGSGHRDNIDSAIHLIEREKVT